MKAHATVKVVAGLAVFMFASFTRAESIAVTAEERAQTDAAGYVEKANFEQFAGDPALYADITYSNAIYVGDGQSLCREYYVFKFPEVTFDPATKMFYAQNDAGIKVPVAVVVDTWMGHRIRPLQGTCVRINNNGGTLQLKLTATTDPSVNRASHWVQTHDINLASQDSLSGR